MNHTKPYRRAQRLRNRFGLEWLKTNVEKYIQEYKSIHKSFVKEEETTTEFFTGLLVFYEETTTTMALSKLGKFLSLCCKKGNEAVINSVVISFFGRLEPHQYSRLRPFIDQATKKIVEDYFRAMYEKNLKDWRVARGRILHREKGM